MAADIVRERSQSKKAELERVWEWTGRLIEELGALQDEIARFADEEKGEEPEEVARWND